MLPLVLPALAASMLMVFAVASRELVTSLLLAPAGVERCRSMCGASSNRVRWAKAWPLATVAVAASLTLMLGASAIRRRGED